MTLSAVSHACYVAMVCCYGMLLWYVGLCCSLYPTVMTVEW